MPTLSQCHLGSPVRENCTPGSAWGDETKRPCLLGEASARKRWRPLGSAQAKVVKTLYQPARSMGLSEWKASVTRSGLSSAIHRRLCIVLSVSRGRSSCPGSVAQKTGEVWLDPRCAEDQARRIWSLCAEVGEQAWP